MNPDPIAYVCCLVFTEDSQHVVLLKKNHGPEILLGKWNGPGGKIEHPETFEQAASREMGEETGVWVAPGQWRRFYHITGLGYNVQFLTARSKAASTAIACEEEEVLVHNVGRVAHPDNSVEYCRNIPWLVLLALDETTQNSCGTSVN